MFTLPQGSGKAVEGQSDGNPILLEDVSNVDFERLLSLFYSECPGDGDLHTVEEWASVLNLATKWEFVVLRDLAIARLSQLASPVERILLARSYDVSQWIAPAYFELCKRDEPLTLGEGERLGMKDVILLSEIRQSIRGNFRVTIQDRNIAALIEKKIV
ncbi:uncharacterized protein LAESUDRAFT_757437 [Laetiporus sulphureus 93-53]|uniref:BTB domain-containing protein n=1 Tax=Laetiporus sulphureus 93-53 TaxID=1314785 RepID=A0A165FBM2_9APHY|nr:uncharacterized protein LAESUDRAFT_757437 [Laetiporus sulphureus 93-53]KZT08722.1 hypothetical protein LAESUDRAFT_757437 [Laetiporus sulphureus 93-53]